MSKRNSARICVFACFVMMVLFIAGCDKAHTPKDQSDQGKDVSKTQPEAAKVTDAEPVGEGSGEKLPPLVFTRLVVTDSPKASSAKSPVRKWLTEHKDVTIHEIGTDGDANRKLQSMIISGQLPDVITLANGADFEQLVQENKLVALDHYIDKYPNISHQLSKQTLNMLRSEDGHIYGLPNWFISSLGRGKGTNGYVINKKIYKELDSPPLITFNDLYNYLVLVKERYPDVSPLLMGPTHNGNVQAQNLFYSGFAAGRIPEMTQTDGLASYPVNKDLESILKDPAFVESYLYTNKLIREQLIPANALNETQKQIEQILKKEKAAVYVGYDILTTISKVNADLANKDPESGYEIIWPLHKEELYGNEIFPSTFQTLGWNKVVITTNAQEPERIFEFLDWSITEEATRLYQYGPQGLMWDEVDSEGAPIPNKAYAAADKDQLAKLELGHFVPFGSYTAKRAMQQQREIKLPAKERSWRVMASLSITSRATKDRTEFLDLEAPPDSEEAAIAVQVKQILAHAFIQMALAENDEEVLSIIDQTIIDTDAVDYAKLLKWKTDKWQANLDKMKGK